MWCTNKNELKRNLITSFYSLHTLYTVLKGWYTNRLKSYFAYYVRITVLSLVTRNKNKEMKQFETSSRVCIAYTKDLEVDLVGFTYDFYCAAGFYTTFVYSKLPLCYDLMICEQCASGRNEWIKP